MMQSFTNYFDISLDHQQNVVSINKRMEKFNSTSWDLYKFNSYFSLSLWLLSSDQKTKLINCLQFLVPPFYWPPNNRIWSIYSIYNEFNSYFSLDLYGCLKLSKNTNLINGLQFKPPFYKLLVIALTLSILSISSTTTFHCVQLPLFIVFIVTLNVQKTTN